MAACQMSKAGAGEGEGAVVKLKKSFRETYLTSLQKSFSCSYFQLHV